MDEYAAHWTYHDALHRYCKEARKYARGERRDLPVYKPCFNPLKTCPRYAGPWPANFGLRCREHTCECNQAPPAAPTSKRHDPEEVAAEFQKYNRSAGEKDENGYVAANDIGGYLRRLPDARLLR